MVSSILFFLSILSMSLSLVTINCNGLRNKTNLKNAFMFFNTSKYDIICLQETWWDDNFVNSFVKYQWEGDIFFSNSENTRSLGVAFLVRKNLDCEVLLNKELIKGRVIELQMKIDDNIFNIINVYAFNVESLRRDLFDFLNNYLSDFLPDDNYFVCGDFNVISNSIDKYNNLLADSSRRHFISLVDTHTLHDVWREGHPDIIEFTWRRFINNILIQSRIDKILCSDSVNHFIKYSAIIPFVWSDHDLVSSAIDFSEVTRGKGIWHFNHELLSNDVYRKDIITCIDAMKCIPDFDDDIFTWYENLKKCFKDISKRHSKSIAKEKRKNKKVLEKRLKNEYKKAAKYDDYDLTLCKQFESELHNVIIDECNGAIIRAKMKNIEHGERSSKYFFSLEKYRQESHSMKTIKCANGDSLNTSEEILSEARQFYSELYTNDPCDNNTQDVFIDNIDSYLPENDIALCNTPLTLDDLKKSLFKMDNNKSPGSDGLTAEFYRSFFNRLGPILLKIVNTIHDTGELPNTMSQGIISLVPKKGDTSLLKNWRPISLLNIDYKIITKALAKKMSKVIGNIVSPDQTCSVPGRDISDNVLAMRDLVDFIEEKNLGGFLVKIDQEKAFDRVNHEYLFKVLRKFGFPDYFLKWIKIFYTSASSCVKINNFLSEFFPISRGIRQGCPLSAILYVLMAEPMRNAIVNNTRINCFNIKGAKALIFQHADDSTFFVKDMKSIQTIFGVFEEYSKASGSKVNIEKSEILPIGGSNPPEDGKVKVIKGHTEVLGLCIGPDKYACEHENWDNKINKCLKILKTWKARKMSLKGKVLIVNTLIISRIIYVLNLSHLPDWVAPKLKAAIIDFIWSGKRHRIKYDVLISSIKAGGLGLLDIERMRNALRCKFIKKLFDNDRPLNPVAKALLLYNLNKGLDLDYDIFRVFVPRKLKCKLTKFSSEILNAWEKVTDKFLVKPMNVDEVLHQPLMYNPFIVNDDGDTFDVIDIFNNDFCTLKDMIYEYVPGFLPNQSIIELMSPVFNNSKLSKLCTNLVQYIPSKWKKAINRSALAKKKCNTITLHMMDQNTDTIIDVSKTSTRFFNNLLRKYEEVSVTPAGLEHWRAHFGNESLKIPFDVCFGGLKENYMCQNDYFLAHNCLYTNDKLVKMGITDDPLCSFCADDIETIYHLFVNCINVESLQRIVKQVCHKILGKTIRSDNFIRYLLFGFPNMKDKHVFNLINYVLCNYRFTVWSARLWKGRNQNVSINEIFKSFIRKRIELEYNSHTMNESLTTFFEVFGIRDALVARTATSYELCF